MEGGIKRFVLKYTQIACISLNKLCRADSC